MVLPQGYPGHGRGLNYQLQLAIQMAVPLSRPGRRSKKWWHPDISKGKFQFANATKHAQRCPESNDARLLRRQAANWWRKTVRKAQWKHWDTTFHECNRSNMHKAIRAPGKPKTRQGLLDIQSASSFQGKCMILQDAFFPANATRMAPPPHRTQVTHGRQSEQTRPRKPWPAPNPTRRPE